MSHLSAVNQVLFAKNVWICIYFRKMNKNVFYAEIKSQKKMLTIIWEEIVLKSIVETQNVMIQTKKSFLKIMMTIWIFATQKEYVQMAVKFKWKILIKLNLILPNAENVNFAFNKLIWKLLMSMIAFKIF